MVLAAAVFAGEASAPLVALLVVLAPLLALVAGGRGRRESPPSVVTAVAGLATVGTVLSANVMIMMGVARLWGVPLRQSLALLGVSTCAVLVWRRAAALWSGVLILGIAGLTGIVMSMGVVIPAAPWTAWTDLASRPALTFAPGAAWVTDGGTLPRPTTLVFNEVHQVTALSTGVFGVEEGERKDGRIRERRLDPGESLALRAGDRLTIPADTRVRFEAGKRIPGAPPSGAAWAEPMRQASWPTFVEALGLTVTLVGGAVTVLGGHARTTRLTAAFAVPLLLIAFALSASSWGVYAVWFAMDRGLGAPKLGPLLEAVNLSLGNHQLSHLLLIGILGLVALFIAAAAGLANRVEILTEPWRGDEERPAGRLFPDVLWVGMVAVGVMLSLGELEPGALLAFGWGLGASAWAAPRLGGARAGTGAGSVTGVIVFVALSIARTLAVPGLAPLDSYPALVAAPTAVVAAVLGRRRPASQGAGGRRQPWPSVAGSRRP